MELRTKILSRVVIDPSGCWLWQGAKTSAGYGHLYLSGVHHYVHRAMYQLEKGPIPAGLTIDHLCRRRSCCNPAHLEAVPQRENAMRGEHPAFVTARTGVCQRGHSITGDNAKFNKTKGAHQCRTCYNDTRRARRHEAADRRLAKRRAR